MNQSTPPFGAYAPAPPLRMLLRLTAALPDQWLARRLAFALRAIGLKMIGGTPVDWKTIGVRWRLYPQNNVTEKRLLFTPAYFDHEERDYISALVKPGFVLVDAGANAGGYALSIAALAPRDSRILAIEPQPEMVRRLMDNCALNELGSVTVAPVALAAEPGTVTMAIHPDDLGGTKISSGTKGPSVDVPALPLLDLLREQALSHIDVLKMDVEGYEEIIITQFLNSAPETLFPRHILMEDNRRLWSHEFAALLAVKGYRIVKQNRMNIYYAL